jgi:hypothetical protein
VIKITYEVVYYCHVLPTWQTKESRLTLEEAETKLKEWEDRKKGDKSKQDCCKYFIQPEI